MNEGETKITSSEQPRVKDPKRVEQGKRLAKISKSAKEKKARERYDRERELLDDTEGTDLTIPIGIGVGVVAVVGLCYVCCKRGQPTQMEPTEPSPEPEPTTRRRRAAPLDSFD